MGSPRAAIFDVDGVLLDVSERMREAERMAGCLRCPDFWRFFHDPRLIRELDRPRLLGIRMARRRLEAGIDVIVVSGRPEALRSVTIEQLRSLGIRPRRILLKPRGWRSSTAAFKARCVEDLVYAEGLVILEIHDDDPVSLHAMGRVAREAALILHTPGGYEELRSGAPLSMR